MNRLFCLLSLLLLSALQVGCDKPPEIQQYRISKSRSDLGDIGKSRFPDSTTSTAAIPTSTRMIVAIAERDDATWFFKITGPVAAVNDTEKIWTGLLSKVTFGSDGQPQWETPEGWELGPAKQFRFATLKTNIADKGDVELSISSLGPDQDLLSNVNRWRGQLQLVPIQQEELQLGDMDSADSKFKMFDATGTMNSASPMVPRPRAGEIDLIYNVPEGWKKGATNSIVKVRLTKGAEKTDPQITVTQLLAEANEWIPNAQRWARQVDMDDSAEFSQQQTTDVSVDGIAGQRIHLVPDDEDKDFGLVGVMVVRADLAWFFKLFGNRQEIAACEKDFDNFLESFRFE